MSCLVSAVTYVCEISKNKQTKNSCWPVFINLISCKVFRGSQVTSGPHFEDMTGKCAHITTFSFTVESHIQQKALFFFLHWLLAKKKKKICQDSFSVLQLRGNTMLFKHFIVTLYHDHICFFFNLAQKVWSMSSMLINLGSSEGSRKRPSKTRMCFFVARFNLFIHYWFTGNCWKQPFH